MERVTLIILFLGWHIFRYASISSSDDCHWLTHSLADWKLMVLHHLSSHHWDWDWEWLDHRLDQIDHRLDPLNNWLDRLDHRFDRLDHWFDWIDYQLDWLDHQLDHKLDQLGHKIFTYLLIPGPTFWKVGIWAKLSGKTWRRKKKC